MRNSTERVHHRNIRSHSNVFTGFQFEHLQVNGSYVAQQGPDSFEEDQQEYGLLTRKVFMVDEIEWNRLNERRNKIRQQKRIDGLSFLGLPVVAPTTRFVLLWACLVFFVDAVFTAFFLPIHIVFRGQCNQYRPCDTWDFVLIAIDSIYVADFLFAFHIGCIVIYQGQKNLIMDARSIVLYYIKRGTFLIDFLTTISCIIQVVMIFEVLPKITYHLLSFLTLIRICRMLRLARVVWVIKASYSISFFSHIPGLQIFGSLILQILNLVYCLAAMVNILGCFFYEVAKFNPGGLQNSWVSHQGLLESSLMLRYLACIYYAITTVSTVGYGDIYPVTWLEQIAAIIIIIVGLVFFAFLVGMVAELLHSLSKKLSCGQIYKEKVEQVDKWMALRGFTPLLRNDIHRYYSMKASFEEDADFMYLEELPMGLKSKVIFEIIQPIVDFVPVLRICMPNTLGHLASRLIPQNSTIGGDLCQQGDEANFAWLLIDGVVRCSRYGKQMQEVVAPCFIVDAALLSSTYPEIGKKQLFTITCVTVCRVMQVDMSDLQYLIKVHPEMQEILIDQLHQFLTTSMAYFPAGDPQIQQVLKLVEKISIKPVLNKSSSSKSMGRGKQDQCVFWEGHKSPSTVLYTPARQNSQESSPFLTFVVDDENG